MKTNFEQDLVNCLAVLRDGGVILYPTDTIWGLGGDATDPRVVDRIFRIKKRDESKSMIVLLADEKEIRKYVADPDPSIFDFLKTLSRPTTVIFDGALGLAPNLIHEDGSVAIRVVQDEFCRHLIKRFRKPIISTSANHSTEPPPENFSAVTAAIKNSVDFVVSYRQQEEQPSRASAIIRWNRNGAPSVIRD